MPRPRKDGKPAARAIRIGIGRTSGAGKKWRVRSYDPTDGAPHGRVVYIMATTEKPTSSVPEVGQALDELFDPRSEPKPEFVPDADAAHGHQCRSRVGAVCPLRRVRAPQPPDGVPVSDGQGLSRSATS